MKFRFPIVIIDEDYRAENTSGLGIRALAKADPTSALPATATDFLTRNGLLGSPLRAEGVVDATAHSAG